MQNHTLNILKTGQNVFITGSAGTGKTYILNQFILYLKSRKIIPTIVAPTGIAASHLQGQILSQVEPKSGVLYLELDQYHNNNFLSLKRSGK